VQEFERCSRTIFQVPKAIQAGRVWVNQYNTYPAPFGGVKNQDFRENHQPTITVSG
jgi:aldehyde dehydrogenase (NAD+)/aldehyde dehydrogenase